MQLQIQELNEFIRKLFLFDENKTSKFFRKLNDLTNVFENINTRILEIKDYSKRQKVKYTENKENH